MLLWRISLILGPYIVNHFSSIVTSESSMGIQKPRSLRLLLNYHSVDCRELVLHLYIPVTAAPKAKGNGRVVESS